MNCFISTDTTSSRITLDRKLGSGGEGTVYSITGDTSRCVKLYHDKKRTPELEAKLKAMITAPPKDPTLAAGHYSICWPQAIVYEDEACTTFIGFIMPLIDTKVFREYHLLCDKPGATSSVCYRLENFGTGFTYLHMYVVALNLASCVAAIHEAGHAIGDLNDKNILVSTKDSKITIVDCDSFEIRGKDDQIFPCSVYMPEYSAPEVIKHEKIENRQLSDRFALAVLIFKLLMLNTHPYASRGSSVEHLNTPGEKIADGYYPYEDYDDLEVFPPAYALPYDIIPPNIKELFRRCFKEGQHTPEKRPSVMEWFAFIKDMYQQMFELVRKDRVQCTKNSLHMFPLHLTECPWCAMKDDYFPVDFVNKKRMKNVNVEITFDYINESLLPILNEMLSDYHIDSKEYRNINRFSKSKGLSKEEIDKSLKNIRVDLDTIPVGDHPIIEPRELELSNIGINKKGIFKIKSNYIYHSIEVKITTNCDFIKVNKNNITLRSGKEKEIEVMLIVDKMKLEKDETVIKNLQLKICCGKSIFCTIYLPIVICFVAPFRIKDIFSKKLLFSQKYLMLMFFLLFVMITASLRYIKMVEMDLINIMSVFIFAVLLLVNIPLKYYQKLLKTGCLLLFMLFLGLFGFLIAGGIKLLTIIPLTIVIIFLNAFLLSEAIALTDKKRVSKKIISTRWIILIVLIFYLIIGSLLAYFII